MKKVIIIIVISLLFVKLFLAQNYQSFRSDRISYFIDENKDVKAMRIDSVQFDTDSILYTIKSIQEINQDCYTPFGASWLGGKIIVKNNGDNLFYNQNNDTILIKTQAILYDTWEVYELVNEMIITAEIIEVDTLSVCGIIDSVKVVAFQVYDENMLAIEHDLNDVNLILSKNYGIVKVINFYNFPDLTSSTYYYYESLYELELCGISSPELGLQNITWFDVYDFQVGDEMHIERYSEINEFNTGLTTIYEYLYIYTYLERNDFEDSIQYKVESRCQHNYENSDGIGAQYSHDTIMQTIYRNADFDYLPGEVLTNYDQIYYYEMSNDVFSMKSDVSGYQFFYQSYEYEDCFTIPLVDGCFNSNNYYKALGGPYFNCVAIPYSENYRKLVYYNKNGQTWGTALQISSVNQNNSTISASVLPNPASDYIILTSGDEGLPFYFELRDIYGKIIESNHISSNRITIDISQYSKGIYFCFLKNNDGGVKTIKLVVY